ncbi:hypothetical protein LJC07_04265 [Christensenellaceae bacterium OttesenSCG-928-L17]|nr:hypothetical protein [Christensenellaceae bacterium OttesenSCG-928-L17]
MSFVKTTFVNGAPPAISADELNKIGTAIEDLYRTAELYAIYDSSQSTESQYVVDTPGYDSEPTENLPIVISFIPGVTNASGAQFLPSWSETAYPIYDKSTNSAVLPGTIKAGQPTTLLFDGDRFWVSGGGNYLQYRCKNISL